MEIVTTLFSGPILPATLLLLVMLFWSFMALLGSVDLDLPGTDMDFDVDLDASTANPIADGMSALTLKWLNLKTVPIIIWMAVFSVTWWFLSASLWSLVDRHFFDPPGWLWSCLLVAKNLAIALPLTKLITTPMQGWFTVEQLTAMSLVGQECEISSFTASPDFGQVKFKTEGAPLLLNVHTDGPNLAQGARVWITHYDAKKRIYIVSPTTTGTATDVPSSEEPHR